MKLTKYKCDCCGTEMTIAGRILFQNTAACGEQTVKQFEFSDMDLCVKCLSRISNGITRFIDAEKKKHEKEAEEDRQDEERRKKSVPKMVDSYKILALKRAGWSIEKIADEMDISTSSVKYHLKKMQ